VASKPQSQSYITAPDLGAISVILSTNEEKWVRSLDTAVEQNHQILFPEDKLRKFTEALLTFSMDAL
jgi:hypothetical protein